MPDTPLLKNGIAQVLHNKRGNGCAALPTECRARRLPESGKGGYDPANGGEGSRGYPPTPMAGGYDRFETQQGGGVCRIPPLHSGK